MKRWHISPVADRFMDVSPDQIATWKTGGREEVKWKWEGIIKAQENLYYFLIEPNWLRQIGIPSLQAIVINFGSQMSSK